MGIPDGVTKLVTSGTLAGGEKFAFSLYYTGYSAWPASGSFDLTLLDISGAWNAFRDAARAIMRLNDFITSYDTYYYQGGHAIVHQTLAVNYAGTGAAGSLPCQIAAVMTLRSALATRSGRGRIYLPATGAAVVNTTSLFSATGINACVDKLALYAQNVRAGGTNSLVVVSQTMSATHPIVTVDADLVPDTQRRRRNKLSSSRHSAAA